MMFPESLRDIWHKVVIKSGSVVAHTKMLVRLNKKTNVLNIYSKMLVTDCNRINEWFIATINKANGGPFAAAKRRADRNLSSSGKLIKR
jgi:hypothetical protein